MYKEIYDNLLEYYRGEYETFNGVSSFDISIKPFTLDEQIMRYGKHISFWYLKKDQLDLINPPDKKEHEIFLNMEIKRSMSMIKLMLPKKAMKEILTMIVETRKIQMLFLKQMVETHF